MNRQVLCNGRTYLVDDSNGGLFHGDTRHLLPPEITVDGKQQEQLAARQETSSSRRLIHADSETTNLLQNGVSHTGITIRRHQTIPEEGRFNEHLSITNHRREAFSGALTVNLETDFADILDI
ncbi:MAG: glycogen debranching N-terminal domain-containing protein, partial [Candidatus Nanohaloarchaea archaeon]|nr:glycogen debranching N-terminal domain-containing protein [Candidatus Nanohaloarchaea archaeon]